MNFTKKLALFTTILLLLLGLSASVVSASVTIPNFLMCANPQGGTIVASYSSGIHGIVGDTAEYRGSDTVYQISPDTYTQCFCPEAGDGVQSNWLKVLSLSQDQIQELKNEGWHYIPNGALWGLDEVPYMVQNANYDCGKSDHSGGIGGQILAAAASATNDPQVLGLAATGTLPTIVAMFAIGFAFIIFGLLTRKNHQK